jgi:hypothetical protein
MGRMAATTKLSSTQAKKNQNNKKDAEDNDNKNLITTQTALGRAQGGLRLGSGHRADKDIRGSLGTDYSPVPGHLSSSNFPMPSQVGEEIRGS